MVRHVLGLMWNRRSVSVLVVFEIAATFVVTFVVAALSLHAWDNYRRPLGFSYENIWRVSVNKAMSESPIGPGDARAIEDIRAALRHVPGVLGAQSIHSTPFTGSIVARPLGREKEQVTTATNILSAAGVADLGVRIIAGRSFGPEDEGQDYRAALVSRDFVNMAFRGASPLGKRINFQTPEMFSALGVELNAQQRRELLREIRPVGVIEDFRQNGEFTEAAPTVILLESPQDSVSSELFVKVVPGAQRRLEERLVAAVTGAAAGFNATVTPWEELRSAHHLEALLPLRIGATLAVFLLAMVALGLVGIVWQDVVRRTHEMGVRRAAGASAGAVRGQILLEVLVIGAAGVAFGALTAIQVPLLSIVPQIDWPAAGPALGLSAVLMLALAAGAALYPALLASGRQPAAALRYE